MRVLILRPEPGNTATAKQVVVMGMEAVRTPLFDIVPLAWEAPDPANFDAVVMTSGNAPRCGGPGLARYTHLPLYAVGEATASFARDAGFGNIVIGKGNAKDLAAALKPRDLHLLHLAGERHKPLGLPDTTAIAVYASRPSAVAALPQADVALVHSPRAGGRLAELASDRDLSVIAISPDAAAACGPGWRAVHIASAPREAAMLECLAKLCEAGRA